MFRRSSKCESANCLMVDTDAPKVRVRDSKDPAGPVLAFEPKAWKAFLSGLK